MLRRRYHSRGWRGAKIRHSTAACCARVARRKDDSLSGNNWLWLCGLIAAALLLAPTIIRYVAQRAFLYQKRRRLLDRFSGRLARKS